MPNTTPRPPKYRHYKPKDLAVVRIDGRDIYLGKYDSAESREKYHRLVADWLACRASGPPTGPDAASPDALTIDQLILAFWTQHATGHYRHADGTPTGELDNFRDSLRPLRRLYGTTLASRFSPLALKAVRRSMIESGLARSTINQRVGRIVRVFKWGVGEELVPVVVYQALNTVAGLQNGRSQAREPLPVTIVPRDRVEAIRPYVSRQVWAMVELQCLTGMRPGEVTGMRSGDVDTADDVWVYVPSRHKTLHRGRERKIYLGPKAQAVLQTWLLTDPSAFLFSPKEAVAERLAGRRRSLQEPGVDRQAARSPGRQPGARYTPRTYHHAIRYGCKKGGLKPWHPHQLRHNAATHLRKEFGLDVARVILGHTSPATAEIYAELDWSKAKEVMLRVG